MVPTLLVSLSLLGSPAFASPMDPGSDVARPEHVDRNDAAARKEGTGGGRREKASRPKSGGSQPSAPARPAGPAGGSGAGTADRGGSGDRGGSDDRGSDDRGSGDRGSGDRGSDDRGSDDRGSDDRGSPDRATPSRPVDHRPAGSPAPGADAHRPSPGVTRPVQAGGPGPAQAGPSGAADRGRPAPANFRPPAAAPPNRPAAGPPAGHGGPPPGAHGDPPPRGAAAAHTAAAHHQAAAAHHPNRAAAAHAAANHRAAWSRHYRSAHPWRFGAYRPVVVAWYPGYPRYWYHGVFVYGPPPYARSEAAAEAAPKKVVDRDETWAIGVRGGTYASGYTNGASYSDFGMGIAVRYRPADALGLELQWTYHDQSWDASTERIDQPLSASVELFAFPWTRFNPYVLAGVTYTNRNVQDSVGNLFIDEDHPVWGPHLGVGLELGVGKSWSVNGDLRGVGYLNDGGDDQFRHGAAQANLGVNYYF